jgi:excisionase family DNA binding protein
MLSNIPPEHLSILRELTALVRELTQRPVSLERTHYQVDELAVKLGLSESHIRRALKSGELRYSAMGKPRRGRGSKPNLIAWSDVLAWIERHRVEVAPAKVEREALVDKWFGGKTG